MACFPLRVIWGMSFSSRTADGWDTENKGLSATYTESREASCLNGPVLLPPDVASFASKATIWLCADLSLTVPDLLFYMLTENLIQMCAIYFFLQPWDQICTLHLSVAMTQPSPWRPVTLVTWVWPVSTSIPIYNFSMATEESPQLSEMVPSRKTFAGLRITCSRCT